MLKKIYSNFDIKQLGNEDDRTIRFIGTNETKDRDKDIIISKGWTTENYKKNPVFLAMHDYKTLPIGKTINLETKGKNMIFDVKFPSIQDISDKQNPSEHAKFIETVYKMYKLKYINAVSVGFDPSEWTEESDEKGYGLRFEKQDLLELSAVPVPSNPEALQMAKSEGIVNDDNIKLFTKIIEKEKGFDNFISKDKDNDKELNKLEQLKKLEKKVEALTLSFNDFVEKSKKSITIKDLDTLKTEINEEVKNTIKQSKDDICLEDIDYVKDVEKNTDKDELEIDKIELVNMIKETVQNEFKKAKGENKI